MKQERCPKCGGSLGIPDKLRGQPVRCPVCKLEFVPGQSESNVGPSAAASLPKPTLRSNTEKSASPKSPTIRSLPVPSALHDSNEIESYQDDDFDLPDTLEQTTKKPAAPKSKSKNKLRLGTISPGNKSLHDDMSPPGKKHKLQDVADAAPVRDPLPESLENKTVPDTAPSAKKPLPTLNVVPVPGREPSIPMATSKRKSRSLPTSVPLAVAPVAEMQHETTIPVEPSLPAKKHLDSNAVARIIKTENVKPQLTVDGKLPSLHLVEKGEVAPVESEWKSNPAIVGLILCGSLILSGMLLLVSGNESASAKKAVDDAREKITQFYEIREDEELKPFQRELRSGPTGSLSGRLSGGNSVVPKSDGSISFGRSRSL